MRREISAARHSIVSFFLQHSIKCSCSTLWLPSTATVYHPRKGDDKVPIQQSEAVVEALRREGHEVGAQSDDTPNSVVANTSCLRMVPYR